MPLGVGWSAASRQVALMLLGWVGWKGGCLRCVVCGDVQGWGPVALGSELPRGGEEWGA